MAKLLKRRDKAAAWLQADEIQQGDQIHEVGLVYPVRRVYRENDEIVVMGPQLVRRFQPDDLVAVVGRKTAAPIHEDAKQRWFYHGTPSEKNAQAIMSQGIQPREITMPDKARSKEQLAPARGRVYCTSDIGKSAIGNNGKFDPKRKSITGTVAETSHHTGPLPESVAEDVSLLLKSSSSRDLLSMFFPKVKDPNLRDKTAEQNIPKSIFVEALKALNDKLKESNDRLTFLCVGGGAMMLHYGTREETHDLDGLPSPNNSAAVALLHSKAEEVVDQFREEGRYALPVDWINTEVRDIMMEQTYRKENFETAPQYSWPNLKLMFAKPGYLLAMKCHALRLGKKDFSDIIAMIKFLKIRTIAQLEDTVSQYLDWSYIGNDEIGTLKLAIAWAYPGETQYENIRQKALAIYRNVKNKNENH